MGARKGTKVDKQGYSDVIIKKSGATLFMRFFLLVVVHQGPCFSCIVAGDKRTVPAVGQRAIEVRNDVNGILNFIEAYLTALIRLSELDFSFLLLI